MYSTSYLLYVFLAGCAGFFYQYGEQERRGAGILWGGVSVVLSIGALYGMGWGMGGCFVAQLALFLFATGLNMGFRMPVPPKD